MLSKRELLEQHQKESTLEKALRLAEIKIIAEAKLGRKESTFRDQPFGSWGYKKDKDYEVFKVTMEELGYKVKTFYHELQFVDTGVSISWED